MPSTLHVTLYNGSAKPVACTDKTQVIYAPEMKQAQMSKAPSSQVSIYLCLVRRSVAEPLSLFFRSRVHQLCQDSGTFSLCTSKMRTCAKCGGYCKREVCTYDVPRLEMLTMRAAAMRAEEQGNSPEAPCEEQTEPAQVQQAGRKGKRKTGVQQSAPIEVRAGKDD